MCDLGLRNSAGCLGHHNNIGDHVHIGPGVSTAGHVRIGVEAQIARASVTAGAGAVVTRDVPDGVTVVGSPAHPLRC